MLASSALHSIRQTPFLSLLIVALIAVGIGITLPMLTVYANMQDDPIPQKSASLFRVQLDNWAEDRPFREPDEPPYAITYQDARSLSESSIPSRSAAMYASRASIDPDKQGLMPFAATARVTDREFFQMFEVEFSQGNAWSEEADLNGHSVVVLSQGLSDVLFGGGDAVGKTVRIGDQPYSIVGVLKSWQPVPKFYDMDDPFAAVEDFFIPFSALTDHRLQPDYWRSPYPVDIELNLSTFDAFFIGSETVFVQYWVELANDEQRQEYVDFLDSYVAQQQQLGRFPRPVNNRLSDVSEWIETRTEDSDDAGGVTALLVVMVLFFIVCLLNAMNILLTKFLRSRPRVAMLRCLGASQRFVFGQYLLEVTLLAAAGGVMGLALATVGLDAAKALFDRETTQAAVGLAADSTYDAFWHLDTTMIVTSILLALVGGWLAGIYPAWRVCAVPPSTEIKSL